MTWLQAVIDVSETSHDAAARFWSRALGWSAGPAWERHPELRSFEPPEGEPYVHLQQIGGAPRVHVDVEAADPRHTVAAAVETGAELLRTTDDWVSLRSPGGLPFCVLPSGPHAAPGPRTWSDGHRSRLVQVCIDSPASRHEAEVGFWKSLLPGRWVSSPSVEFAGKWHDDDGSPLQLLFQRLEEQDGVVRAHLDLGTDGLPAEVLRLLDLGAEDVGAGRGGWHVLTDPAGLAFCVTENDPAQTARRDLG